MRCPWRLRVEQLLVPGRLEAECAAMRPARVLPPVDGSAAWRLRLSTSYTPSEEGLRLMRVMLESIRDALMVRVPDSNELFVSAMFEPEKIPKLNAIPMLITGLPGLGKTRALQVLKALLEGDGEFSITNGYSNLRSQPIAYASSETTVAPIEVGRQLGASVGQKRLGGKTLADVTRRLNEVFFQAGVGLVVLDELSFRSSGSAGVAAAGLVRKLAALGVPVVYAVNYKLLGKFLALEGEIRRRVLGTVHHVRPDLPGSSCWQHFIKDLCLLSGGVVHSSVLTVEHVTEIWRMTFGIKSAVINLFSLAIDEALARGTAVELEHLRSAFNEDSYYSDRVTMAALSRLAQTGKTDRSDLVYPMRPKDLAKWFGAESALEAERQRTLEDVARKVTESGATLDEQRRLKEIRKKSGEPARDPVLAPVKKPKARKGATVEEILAVEDRLLEML